MTTEKTVDLAELCAVLRQGCAPEQLVGYLRGKTEMRDVLVDRFECSQLEAEDWVDTLEARRFIRFDGDPGAVDRDRGMWHVSGPASPPAVVIEPGEH